MKNLTKILSLLLLGALVFTIGCEDGGSGGDDFLLSREAKVKFVSDSYVPDAIFILRDDFGNDILIKATTPVFVQRESESGFSKGNASEIRPDAEIEYFYYIENADFSQSPAIYEIERIFVTN
jgi:hypothetical protein